jgi:hypothetical protein
MNNESSVQNALESICNRLQELYNLTNYTEEIKQGFKEPCFFVETVNVTHKRIGHRRYSRTQAFCIHYFPDLESNKVDDCLNMAESLYFDLEYITVNGNKATGSMMRHDISERTLHFFVNYNYHLIVRKEEDLMESLTQRSRLK